MPTSGSFSFSFVSSRNPAASVPATTVACVNSRSLRNCGKFAEADSKRWINFNRAGPCWVCAVSPDELDSTIPPEDTTHLAFAASWLSTAAGMVTFTSKPAGLSWSFAGVFPERTVCVAAGHVGDGILEDHLTRQRLGIGIISVGFGDRASPTFNPSACRVEDAFPPRAAYFHQSHGRLRPCRHPLLRPVGHSPFPPRLCPHRRTQRHLLNLDLLLVHFRQLLSCSSWATRIFSSATW